MNYNNVTGMVVLWLVPTPDDSKPSFAIHGYIYSHTHNHIETHIMKINKNTSFLKENFRNISFCAYS